MMFDPKKPVQTRDGRKVEIVAVLDEPMSSGETIIARILGELRLFHPSGQYYQNKTDNFDLINIPDQQPELWAVQIVGGLMTIFISKEDAVRYYKDGTLVSIYRIDAKLTKVED